MEDIRKNQHVAIKLRSGNTLDGIVLDFLPDRLLVLVEDRCVAIASSLKELDEVYVSVDTHFGRKSMITHILSTLNRKNCLIIENGKEIPYSSKREYVRISSDLLFNIDFENSTYLAETVDISGGSVAFRCRSYNFCVGDIITIKFSFNDVGDNIFISAKILYIKGDIYIAEYFNIKEKDRDKVIKFVFQEMAKKR